MRCIAILIVLSCCFGIASAQSLNDDDLRIANEGGIGEWWQLADGARIVAPGYPASAVAEKSDVCLAIGYVVQEDGSTADHVVVKRWSDAGAGAEDVEWDQFAKAASLALTQWRFGPKAGAVARPTFTVATFAFAGTGMPAQDLRQHCKVNDVLAAVVAVREQAYDRGSLNREWLDRAYRETIRRETRANQASRCRTSHSMTPDCFD